MEKLNYSYTRVCKTVSIIRYMYHVFQLTPTVDCDLTNEIK